MRDVADQPPPNGTWRAGASNFEWARAVGDRLRGTHPELEQLFDEAYVRKHNRCRQSSVVTHTHEQTAGNRRRAGPVGLLIALALAKQDIPGSCRGRARVTWTARRHYHPRRLEMMAPYAHHRRDAHRRRSRFRSGRSVTGRKGVIVEGDVS